MSKSYEVKTEWLKKKDSLNYIISTWCKKKSDTEVTCIICAKDISCQRKGFAALTQHFATSLHIKNASLKLTSKQLLLKPRESGNFTCAAIVPFNVKNTTTNSNSGNIPEPCSSAPNKVQLFNIQEPCTRAELYWAMKSVQTNMAPGSCDDLKEVFEVMFPNAVPDNFSLGRTKLSYLITEALGPYFHSNLKEDVKNSCYSLLYDETTNHANKKELQFNVRYWSEKEKEVVCSHLKTVFIGHATAFDLKREIDLVLKDSDLSTNKLLMLGSDGPRVNQKVWRLVNNELTEERGKGLVDIGTCNLHVVHNAYLKGVDEFGEVAKELITDIYSFFKKFPSRWEDYSSIQEKVGIAKTRFIKHVSTRWLTIGPAAERLLSQWPAIEEYFLKFIPVKLAVLMKTEKYKRISKSLKIVDIKLELKFLSESANLFEPFLQLFQRSEPLVHVLYSKLSTTLKKIAGRICKKDEINVHKVISSSQLLPVKEIFCGEELKNLCLELKEADCQKFKHNMQKHYLAAFNYLVKKTNLDAGKFLSYFQCLQPAEVAKEKSLKYACFIAKSLSFLGVNDVQLRDEWILLQTEIVVPPKDLNVRIDHFWREVINETNEMGKCKYPTVATFVKACLTLSHGNSDVERGFSISQRVLSDDKASMSEKMLNARLNVREGLKKFLNVSQVPITKTLLMLAYNASNSYRSYLEEQRELKEKQTKENAEKEEEKKRLQMLKEELKSKKEGIDVLECKAKVLATEHKDMQSSADSLLKEGNERLRNALKKNDNVEIQVAQGLLEAAEKLRQKERQHEQETIKINQIVNKRKSNLISYFSKAPKIQKLN